MKKLFIIANWKSNKTIEETEKWFHDFSNKLNSEALDLSNIEIIVCPSFISLEHAKYCNENLKLPVKLGAQNISLFDKGAYTGEVYGGQIREACDYVIIGHSERRVNFKETDEELSKKVLIAKQYNLTPIFCVQSENTPVPSDIEVVAYEPIFAIGTGNPDTPDNAQNVANIIKKKSKCPFVLYGGSVTPQNVKSFSSMEDLNGFLVGGASLDPLEFLQIIKNV